MYILYLIFIIYNIYDETHLGIFLQTETLYCILAYSKGIKLNAGNIMYYTELSSRTWLRQCRANPVLQHTVDTGGLGFTCTDCVDYGV